VPIADRGLRHLRDERLGIAQQQVHHRRGAIEFLLQQLRFHPVSIAGALHHGPARRGLAAHEKRYAEYPLVADHCDFGRRTVLHDIEERHDRGRREIDMPQASARLVQRLTEAHRDEFQMLLQTRELGRRQRREKVVLPGGVWGGQPAHCTYVRYRTDGADCYMSKCRRVGAAADCMR
jgi:hypothetical protein